MGLMRSMIREVLTQTVRELGTAERAAFEALCLFPAAPNTFALSAAVTVVNCDAGMLQSIVDAGMLERTEGGRYSLHPLLVASATHSGNDSARVRFAGYFANYAGTHRDEARALEAEYVNMLAAFGYGDDGQRTAIALALSHYLELRGDYGTWNRLVTEAHTVSGEAPASLVLQRALVAEKLGNNHEAERQARFGLQIAEKNDAAALPDLLTILSHAEMNLGKLEEAHANLTRAVELSERMPGSRAMFGALRLLGVAATRLSHLEEADKCLNQALALATAIHDTASEATLWTDIGVLWAAQGKLGDALDACGKALEAARRSGYSEKEAAALEWRGAVLIRTGRLDEAACDLGEALTIARRIEHAWYVGTILNQLGNLSLAKSDLDGALRWYREAEQGYALDTPDVLAHALFGIARVYGRQGERELAMECARQALGLLEGMSHSGAREALEWMATQAWG